MKPDDLDIVEEDDQITHLIALDEELAVEEALDVFKFDPEYLENEEKYREIKHEILGDSSDEDGSEGDDEGEGDEEDEDMDENDKREKEIQEMQTRMEIQDKTDTNMINLRKTVYLTIMSSLDYEEACHKLMKMALKPGQEVGECRVDRIHPRSEACVA